MKQNSYRLEIFCGTGGVGKTTLASSRATSLAIEGKRVLLITIDPALRLKQVFGLNETGAGNKSVVSVEHPETKKEVTFDALLMNPEETFKRLNIKQDKPNKILDILMRPNGGMNEIMAIIEVQQHLEERQYDTIVLDTPPGKHFIDFLNASQKIDRFFDKNFVEVFKFFGKNLQKTTERFSSRKLVRRLVSSGVSKLLSYLEKVTGKEFVETFVDAIFTLYNNKDQFIVALKFQDYLKKSESYRWYLVASTEQQKVREIVDLTGEASHISKSSASLLINKCIGDHIANLDDSLSEENKVIQEYYLNREKEIIEFSRETDLFEEVKKFPESLSSDPLKHVFELSKYW